MSRPPSNAELRERDAEVWRRAQSVFERPCVVEAGAGTGKTTLLVARCLAWTLGPGWEKAEERLPGADVDRVAADVLARVAALTFTEAAAAEMAQRVGKALAKVLAGGLPIGMIESALPVAGVRGVRATALLGALDRLLVRTLHAFCRRLLAQYALEAGLHPDFEVDADGRACETTAREVVAAGLAEGYADPGDPDWLALALDGFGPPELQESLAALLAAGTTPDALARDPFAPEALRAWLTELEDALRRFEDDAGRLLDRTARGSPTTPETLAVIRAIASLLARGAVDGEALAQLVDELKSVWSEKYAARLHKWSREDFGAKERAALGDAIPRAAQAAAALRYVIRSATQLEPRRLACARRVLGRLLVRGRERMRARGQLGYAELLRGARDLLRDHPEVRARVRGELDQLCIDEFQDTDRVQCDLLRWLALDGPAAERPGLFLVGDPKQSIYAWREADLEAYEGFVREALGGDAEPERLRVNRRSTPPILAEVERVIAPVMRAQSGIQPAFQALVPSEENEAEPAYVSEGRAAVEHWISWLWDPETAAPNRPRARVAAQLEARAIAMDLVRLRRSEGLAWRDAGLLLRARGDLELYLRALRDAGVPYAVDRDRSYYRRREVIDASALVCCVLDPTDTLALLTWLRSPSVGVPDAALLPLWAQKLPDQVAALAGDDREHLAALDRTLDAALADLPDDVPGLERIAGWERSLRFALAALGSLRESFTSDPADVFVENLRSLTLVELTEAARYLGAYRFANLERFFRDLRAQLEAEDVDVQALLRRLRSDVVMEREVEDARPPESSEDAVRVMTIHQAKGLEFTHCYVAQLHKQPGRGRARRPFVWREIDGVLEYRLCDAATLGFGRVEAYREQVGAAERVRSLYVAMTRARKRLVLLANREESEEPIAPEQAAAHAQLLHARRNGQPVLAASMQEAARAGRDGVSDADGVRWAFPALRGEPEAAEAVERNEGELPGFVALVDEARRLAAWRDAAARRMARPLRAAASADSHAEAREAEAERLFRVSDAPAAADAEPPDAEAARAAGTAVHRALEHLRLDRDLRAGLASAGESLAARLEPLAAPAARPVALERARALLARLAQGPLLVRFAALSEHVIARELPVLLPVESEGDGPVGFVAGAIDLLYRDPATGEYVVVDYKSDRVEGEAALAERAAVYRGQAENYRCAVQEALALPQPPRFELWFLHAGEIVPLG